MQDLFIGTLDGLPQVMQIEADGDYTGTIITSNQAMDGAWGWDEVTNNTIVYNTGKWYGLVNWAGLYVDAQKYFDSTSSEKYIYLIKTVNKGEIQSGNYTTTFAYTRYKVTNSAGNSVAKRIKKMYIGAPTTINTDKDIKIDANSQQTFTDKEIIISSAITGDNYSYPASSIASLTLKKDSQTSFTALMAFNNDDYILNKCCLFEGDYNHVYRITSIKSKEQLFTQSADDEQKNISVQAGDLASDVKIVGSGYMYDVAIEGVTPHKIVQGYIGDANNIARKFINTDGNYLYAIKVILSTGEPVPDVTITGINAVGGGTAVTNDKGYVLCSSTMLSVTLSVDSPYMDALSTENQAVNHDGSYICSATLVLGVVTSGGHIIRANGVYKFSSNVKKADFWGIGGGGGGSAYVRNNSSYSNGHGGVGGGSGYTSNVYNVDIVETDRFTVNLGEGGVGGYAQVTGWGASADAYGSDGGRTTILKNGTNILTADGGKAWSDTSNPNGGSGGGGYIAGSIQQGADGGRNGSDGASTISGVSVGYYGNGQGSPTSPFEEISSTTVNVGYGGGGAGVYGYNAGSSSGVVASYVSGNSYDGGATGKAMTLGGSGDNGTDGGGGGPLLVLRVTDTRPTTTLTGAGGKGGNGVVIARWGY